MPEGKSSNRDQLHAGINNKLHDFTPVRDVFQLNTTLCHNNCLTELPKQTATDQALNKDSEVSFFQVMKVVSDKHDLSSVQKVNFPEEQVLRLCNGIAPNSLSL